MRRSNTSLCAASFQAEENQGSISLRKRVAGLPMSCCAVSRCAGAEAVEIWFGAISSGTRLPDHAKRSMVNVSTRFRQPPVLRSAICADASKAQSNIAAISAPHRRAGRSTVWVLIRQLRAIPHGGSVEPRSHSTCGSISQALPNARVNSLGAPPPIRDSQLKKMCAHLHLRSGHFATVVAFSLFQTSMELAQALLQASIGQQGLDNGSKLGWTAAPNCN